MARKVVLTETVTAELVATPPPPPPPPPAPPPPAPSARGSDDVDVMVVGVTPAVSLGEQMLALATSMGFAAHNATSFQLNHSTVLGASTALGAATLLAAAVRPVVSDPRPANPRSRRRP